MVCGLSPCSPQAAGGTVMILRETDTHYNGAYTANNPVVHLFIYFLLTLQA